MQRVTVRACCKTCMDLTFPFWRLKQLVLRICQSRRGLVVAGGQLPLASGLVSWQRHRTAILAQGVSIDRFWIGGFRGLCGQQHCSIVRTHFIVRNSRTVREGLVRCIEDAWLDVLAVTCVYADDAHCKRFELSKMVRQHRNLAVRTASKHDCGANFGTSHCAVTPRTDTANPKLLDTAPSAQNVTSLLAELDSSTAPNIRFWRCSAVLLQSQSSTCATFSRLHPPSVPCDVLQAHNPCRTAMSQPASALWEAATNKSIGISVCSSCHSQHSAHQWEAGRQSRHSA